ncbi:hypothetical protein AO888_03305 [Pseudomonas aeruginosa]|nr:hypothetical protein [Pseudomonas aeruginosa]KSC77000.1 hypothetical protein AO888_03305 [Pseudomonas aeruginosa]
MEAQAKLDRADEKNKRLIASVLRSPFIRGMHADPEWLMMHGSPGERAAFVRLARRRTFLMLGGVALIVAVIGSSKPVAAPPAPTFEPAGSVVRIQLHESAFSSSSSVETTEGVFQVQGAVTGASGDVATMKTVDQHGVVRRELCIESKFKSACYTLL